MKPIDFSPGSGRPSKADCIAAIELWTKTRRVADALSIEELGELDPGARLPAFVRAELEATAHLLRQKPKESAIFGVLKAIYVLSDNENGYCDMSQERLGRFFGRGRQHINDCIQELRRQRLIRVEEVKGAPARLSPIVPRLFAEDKIKSATWLFDGLAPYERAKPGRKPKILVTASVTTIPEIPVAIVTTPIKTPVADTTTPISKYLSSKIEIAVVTAATQISYDSPVVEEAEKYTSAREGCNGFSLQTESEQRGLQEAQASKVASTLPSREHLDRFCWLLDHWGLKNGATAEFPFNRHTAKGWLDGILFLGKDFERETQEGALLAALSTAEGVVYDPPSDKDRKGPRACKNFCERTFSGKLLEADKLRRERRKAEHDDRVAAKTVEAMAEIDVKDREEAKKLKRGALNTRLEAGNQAATKRSEDGNARAAGVSSPRASQNSRTIIDENGKRRYNPEAKLMPLIGLVGEHANKLIDELEPKGATFEDIDEAFGKEDGKSGDRTQSREEVFRSVRRTVQKVLDERRDKALRGKFGGPIQQLAEGHMQHPAFISDWVCISREKVAEIAAKCPDVKLYDGEWRYCYRGRKSDGSEWGAEDLMAEKFHEIVRSKFFTHDDYGTGLLERVERELEGFMLEEQQYGATEREVRERKAEEARKQQEAWEQEQREWEATRPEREAKEAERKAKREAEEAQKRAALEADAENLSWDGQTLVLTESGKGRLPAIEHSLLGDVLSAFSKQITSPLARRTGPVNTTDLAQLWRDIKGRVELLNNTGFGFADNYKPEAA